MKKPILVLFFFLITPLNLVAGFFALSNISKIKQFSNLNHPTPLVTSSAQSMPLYAALPQVVGEVLGAVSSSDARPIIIENYLKKHKSPLAPYHSELLSAADKYEVDPWLIIAIAQCESNLCKKAPSESFNCWGFENGTTRFLSWQQALEQVAKTLKERYLDLGLDTPEKIMPKYAPPSVEKGGPWARCVNQFIQELNRGG